jgi:hypothetical protein
MSRPLEAPPSLMLLITVSWSNHLVPRGHRNLKHFFVSALSQSKYFPNTNRGETSEPSNDLRVKKITENNDRERRK